MPDAKRPAESYARVYDDILENPKVRRVLAQDFGLYMALTSYGHRADTDGTCPRTVARHLLTFESDKAWTRALQRLVRAGLVEMTDSNTNLHVHDYCLHNASHAERNAKRIATSNAARIRWAMQPAMQGKGEGKGKGKELIPPSPLNGRAEPEPVIEDQAFQELAVRIIEWFCDHKGWQAVPADHLKRERNRGYAIAMLHIPEPALFDELNRVWHEAKDKPQTLGYFWQPLQLLESALLKSNGSHRKPSIGPTKIGEILH